MSKQKHYANVSFSFLSISTHSHRKQTKSLNVLYTNSHFLLARLFKEKTLLIFAKIKNERSYRQWRMA